MFSLVTCLQTTQHQPKNSCKEADFRQILQFTSCGLILYLNWWLILLSRASFFYLLQIQCSIKIIRIYRWAWHIPVFVSQGRCRPQEWSAGSQNLSHFKKEKVYIRIFRKSPLLVSRSGLLSPKQTLHSVESLYLLGGIIIWFDKMSLDSSPRIISNSNYFLFKIQEEKNCASRVLFS